MLGVKLIHIIKMATGREGVPFKFHINLLSLPDLNEILDKQFAS